MAILKLMEGFLFWQRWLFIVGVVISIFGMFMSFFSGTALFYLFDSNINSIFWGTADVADGVKGFQRWIYGAWGATVAGWGIFVTFIAHYPFQRKEKWSWNCLLSGVLVWFIIDTGFSAYFNVYINVILNTVFLIAVILPLVSTRKHFAG